MLASIIEEEVVVGGVNMSVGKLVTKHSLSFIDECE